MIIGAGTVHFRKGPDENGPNGPRLGSDPQR
jgi:hypothetical protein